MSFKLSPDGPELQIGRLRIYQHNGSELPLTEKEAEAQPQRHWQTAGSGGQVGVTLERSEEENGIRLRLTVAPVTGEPLPVRWSLDLMLTPAAWEVRYPAENGIAETTALPNMLPPDVAGNRNYNPTFVYRVGASSHKEGLSVSVPVLRLEAFTSRERDASGLTVATDPMNGVVFTFGGTMPAVGYGEGGKFDGCTKLTLSGTADFDGGIMTREINLRWDTGGFDASLAALSETLPDISKGPDWLSKIGIIYYDYNSKGGRGWYEHLQCLADQLDAGERGRTCAVIHGWYDFLGRYTQDQGTLLNEWTAFPETRKIPMSIQEIHRRAAFARGLGMRVLLYFADGLLCDSGTGFFKREWLAHGPDHQPIGGWEGPDTLGRTFAMDPAHPEVRSFYLHYLDLLLKEYGTAVDGFVWDETFYILAGYRGYKGHYSDRAMLGLVREMTCRVQAAGNGLAFLTSDATRAYSSQAAPPTALVSHGTYQDSWSNPAAWAGGAFANAGKVLWSCNWHPLTNHHWNLYATRALGYPMSFSDGWGDECGPADLPPEILTECLDAFRTMPPRRRYTRAVCD